MVLDANTSSVGIAGVTNGVANITVIGGGFADGESISVDVKKGGFDVLLSGSISGTNTSTTTGNANGGFTLDVDLEGYPVGVVFTITATGDQGNRGASAFMLIDK